MIVLFEGQPERIHLAMALVALFGPRDVHALTQGHVLVLGQLGIHGDRDIGNVPAQ